MKQYIHIGLDDIDSPYGGCTTHFASLILVELIKKFRVEPIDYPNIIRLNPAVPWKTRGNGSLALRFRINNYSVDEVFEYVINRLYDYLNEYSKNWSIHSQPVVSILTGEPPAEITWFSKKAIQDLVPLDLALRIASKVEGFRFKALTGKNRGLIGSMAGIGYRMIDTDYTYELIAYRDSSYIGSVRKVNEYSVKKMDQLYGEETILNYDYEIDKPLIVPKGPDPVLLGIRGERSDILYEAFKTLDIDEPVPLIVLFRTNQHTDAHLREVSSIANIHPYMCIKVRGVVSRKPRRIVGGHVVFSITDNSGSIDVVAYEPTGGFRNIIEELEVGDVVEVMGITRPKHSGLRLTINLEKIRVVEVRQKTIYQNPLCPKCGVRMKSAGRGKGFKCVKCGYADKKLTKIVVETTRKLQPGYYEPPPRVFKHLMKPLKRIGKEKSFFPKEYRPINFIWMNGSIFA